MLKIVSTGALLALSMSAQADSPSFDYVDIGYNSLEFDFTRLSGGAEFKFSKTLGDHFYLAADIAETTEGGGRLVFKTFGLGYKYNISQSTVFFSEIDFVDVHRDHGDGESNLDGHQMTIGVKRSLTKEFVGTIGVERLDLDFYDDTSLLVGATYGFTDAFAIYAEGRALSDSQRYSVGIRYNF